MDNHRYHGVDVKVQLAPKVKGEEVLSDRTREEVWNEVQAQFWDELATTCAERLGSENVFAEGRSGGWAVPSPVIDPEEDPDGFALFKKIVEETYDSYLEVVYPDAMREAIRAGEPKPFGMAIFPLYGDGKTGDMIEHVEGRTLRETFIAAGNALMGWTPSPDPIDSDEPVGLDVTVEFPTKEEGK